MPLSSLTNRPEFYASASLVSAVNHALQELFQHEAAPLFHASLQLQIHACTLRTDACSLLLLEVANVLTAATDERTNYRLAFGQIYLNDREQNPNGPLTDSAANAHFNAYSAFLDN